MSSVWSAPTPTPSTIVHSVAVIPPGSPKPAAPAPAQASQPPQAPGNPAATPSAAPPATAGAPPVSAGPAPVTPPPASLAANSAYLAFLNSLGLKDADLRNAAALKSGQIGINEASNEPNLQNAENVALDRQERTYNARGLVNSSDNLNARAQLSRAYADRLAAMRNAAATGQANVALQLAQALANGQVQSANVGQKLAGQDAVNAALASSSNPFLPGS